MRLDMKRRGLRWVFSLDRFDSSRLNSSRSSLFFHSPSRRLRSFMGHSHSLLNTSSPTPKPSPSSPVRRPKTELIHLSVLPLQAYPLCPVSCKPDRSHNPLDLFALTTLSQSHGIFLLAYIGRERCRGLYGGIGRSVSRC